jgi:uncharacterized protein
MKRKRSLLLLIGYGFTASLAVFYGLVERESLVATFVSFHLLVCLGIPLLHGWWEGGLADYWRHAWLPFDKKGAGYGLAVGALMLAGILAGIQLLFASGVQPEEIRAVLERWGLTQQAVWWFSLYMAVVNSLLEELFWRGFVLQRLLAAMSRFAAVLLSSLFFCLYHLLVAVVLFGWRWGVWITMLVFATSILWGWLKGVFPAVYATWFSHMLADLGIVLALVIWVYTG